MKKIITALFLVGISLSAFSQKESLNQIDKKGYKQGKWVKKYRSGKIYYQGEFKDNMEVGEFLFYYPNGTIQTKKQFYHNGMVCYAESFYESGGLLSIGKFLNKQKDSIWNYYGERTKKLTMQESYKKGEKEGPSYIFSEKGDTVESVLWKKDKKEGPWFKIYANGFLEGTYKDSKLEGVFKDFYQDGALKETGYYRDGEKIGGWDFFDQKGIKVKFESWRDGVMKERVLYYPEEDAVVPVSVFDMAYFYGKGEQTKVVTFEGQEFIFNYNFADFFALVESDLFLLLNIEKELSVQYNAIKKANYGPKQKILSIVVEPQSDEVIFVPDEEGQKALQAFYREGIEE